MAKWPVQKQTHKTTQKHVEHQDARDIQNIFSCYTVLNRKKVANLCNCCYQYINSWRNS